MPERDPMAVERDWYDLVDFSDHLASAAKVVRSPRAQETKPTTSFAVPLPDALLDVLSTTARSRGLATGDLICQWITERVLQEAIGPALARQEPGPLQDRAWSSEDTPGHLGEDFPAYLTQQWRDQQAEDKPEDENRGLPSRDMHQTDIPDRYRQALDNKKAKSRTGRGIKIGDAELVTYMQQTKRDHPETTSYHEMEIAYWIGGYSFSRTRWRRLWELAFPAGSRAHDDTVTAA